MRKLIIIYGWPLVFMIVSVMFGVKGAMIGLVGSSGLPYAQKYLMSAIELQKYGIVSSFPWTVKPLIGMISDGIPIFGYNKRWYIAISSLVGSCAIYFIATYKFNRSNGLYYIAGWIISGIKPSRIYSRKGNTPKPCDTIQTILRPWFRTCGATLP